MVYYCFNHMTMGENHPQMEYELNGGICQYHAEDGNMTNNVMFGFV